VEEELAEVQRGAAVAAEERALLRQQVTGIGERVRELREAMDAQRGAIVEYLRMTVQSDAIADRRLVEEIERSNKIARDLLLRLEERSEETSQEQPL
jgi:hypothetical protein